MKEILDTLSHNACNLEEHCYGINDIPDFYLDKEQREKLIDGIEDQLGPFVEALNKLKAIK